MKRSAPIAFPFRTRVPTWLEHPDDAMGRPRGCLWLDDAATVQEDDAILAVARERMLELIAADDAIYETDSFTIVGADEAEALRRAIMEEGRNAWSLRSRHGRRPSPPGRTSRGARAPRSQGARRSPQGRRPPASAGAPTGYRILGAAV